MPCIRDPYKRMSTFEFSILTHWSIILFRAALTRQIGWRRNRNLFLIILEATKSKIKVPTDSMSGEIPTFWFRERPLFKGTNDNHESSLMPNYLPEAHLQMRSYFGGTLSVYSIYLYHTTLITIFKKIHFYIQYGKFLQFFKTASAMMFCSLM